MGYGWGMIVECLQCKSLITIKDNAISKTINVGGVYKVGYVCGSCGSGEVDRHEFISNRIIHPNGTNSHNGFVSGVTEDNPSSDDMAKVWER